MVVSGYYYFFSSEKLKVSYLAHVQRQTFRFLSARGTFAQYPTQAGNWKCNVNLIKEYVYDICMAVINCHHSKHDNYGIEVFVHIFPYTIEIFHVFIRESFIITLKGIYHSW